MLLPEFFQRHLMASPLYAEAKAAFDKETATRRAKIIKERNEFQRQSKAELERAAKAVFTLKAEFDAAIAAMRQAKAAHAAAEVYEQDLKVRVAHRAAELRQECLAVADESLVALLSRLDAAEALANRSFMRGDRNNTANLALAEIRNELTAHAESVEPLSVTEVTDLSERIEVALQYR